MMTNIVQYSPTRIPLSDSTSSAYRSHKALQIKVSLLQKLLLGSINSTAFLERETLKHIISRETNNNLNLLQIVTKLLITILLSISSVCFYMCSSTTSYLVSR